LQEPGSLTVTGAINVKYKVTPGKWYSIGFPYNEGQEITVRSEWFEREGWSPLLPYREEAYEDNYYGDYYLKEYNPALNPPFADTQETIAPGKGYIIRFPDYFVDTDNNKGDIITFSSTGEQTLIEGTLPVSENYRLTTNPTLKNITLEAPNSNNEYNYILDPDNNEYLLLENGTKTLAPFEAAITITTSEPENLLRSISAHDGLIGIKNKPLLNNDPIVAERYYTLQGIEVARPAENGIYILKQRYASGNEKAKKIIYKPK
jgi:hypothetical protein